MAKNTHGTRSDLIHCDNCGEDYSSTYKRCPFCGARPDRTAPTQSTTRSSGEGTSRGSSDSRSRQPAQEEDEYVFDGSGVFDDEDDGKGGAGFFSFAGRGGRHLADDGEGLSPTTIIGFIFSGVIILAAILIVILVIIPMVRGGQADQPSGSPTEPVTGSPSPAITSTPSPGPLTSDPVPSGGPAATDPAGSDPTADPSESPSPAASPSPAVSGGITLTYNGSAIADFTISDAWPSPIQLRASGAIGTVTWSSSDITIATVSTSGLVRGVPGNSNKAAYITATDEAGYSQSCKVVVSLSAPSSASSEQPSSSASESASPSASTAPSGTLTLSRDDFTLNSTWPTYTFTVTGASGTITWVSSNTAVATVDASGKVTMVGPGQCRVTATDAEGKTASCIVRCS